MTRRATQTLRYEILTLLRGSPRHETHFACRIGQAPAVRSPKLAGPLVARTVSKPTYSAPEKIPEIGQAASVRARSCNHCLHATLRVSTIAALESPPKRAHGQDFLR